ncbi:MAG: SDR family NAD(P)-dependent oxidoreductase [Bryobacterales bacterium]
MSFDDLKGKTVAITGGGGVLCGAFAEAFVEAGRAWRCSTFAAKRLKRPRRRPAAARSAWSATCFRRASLEAAAGEIRRRLGPIDILVNGAGNVAAATTGVEQLGDPSELEQSFYALDLQPFQKTFDLNFMGTLLPSQKLTLDMVERRKGAIINISSMNAFRPLSKIPAYSAAKASVSNFTEWLAVHLAPVGIRVNALAPGFFLTEQLLYLAKDAQGEWTPRYQRVHAQTPMGRLGNPDELKG